MPKNLDAVTKDEKEKPESSLASPHDSLTSSLSAIAEFKVAVAKINAAVAQIERRKENALKEIDRQRDVATARIGLEMLKSLGNLITTQGRLLGEMQRKADSLLQTLQNAGDRVRSTDVMNQLDTTLRRMGSKLNWW